MQKVSRKGRKRDLSRQQLSKESFCQDMSADRPQLRSCAASHICLWKSLIREQTLDSIHRCIQYDQYEFNINYTVYTITLYWCVLRQICTTHLKSNIWMFCTATGLYPCYLPLWANEENVCLKTVLVKVGWCLVCNINVLHQSHAWVHDEPHDLRWFLEMVIDVVCFPTSVAPVLCAKNDNIQPCITL